MEVDQKRDRQSIEKVKTVLNAHLVENKDEIDMFREQVIENKDEIDMLRNTASRSSRTRTRSRCSE